jgi:DNA-binding LytR/AlgR family response regulator
MLTMIKCIIVDDDPIARCLLTEYVNKIPELELIGEYDSAIKAKFALSHHHVDLLFLDIQMPHLSGIELLKLLSVRPVTIFTTGFEKYALASYELGAIDYLLKPITFERFFQATTRAMEYIQCRNGYRNAELDIHNGTGHDMKEEVPNEPASTELVSDKHTFIKSDHKIVKVSFEKILYVEGLREYINIQMEERKNITLMPLHKLQQLLPGKNFVQVHKSFIINIEKIDTIQGNQIQIGKTAIPIGKTYRNGFFKVIDHQLKS